MRIAHISAPGPFKPGDMPPASKTYAAMTEWAEVQIRGGLTQDSCGRCARYFFPQEMSARTTEHLLTDRHGQRVVRTARLCIRCAAQQQGEEGGGDA